jgi:hypothetical protein
MSSEHSEENYVPDKSLVELNQQRMTDREKWEKMAEEICIEKFPLPNVVPSRTINRCRFCDIRWFDDEESRHRDNCYIPAIADAIEKAVLPYKQLAEQLKQGVQQIVPLGAVDQIVGQQEEIDRLKTELERVTNLSWWAHTCIHHNDVQRRSLSIKCPVCLTAELLKLSEQCDASNEESSRMESERGTAHQQLQEVYELLKHLHKEVLDTDYNEHWESFIRLETYLAHQKGETK